MGKIIDLREFFGSRHSPLLVLVDLYHEHALAEELCANAITAAAIANCRSALAHAHQMRLPVAYVRRHEQPSFASMRKRSCHWLPGLQPTRADMVFDQDQYSCYANPAFEEMMNYAGGIFVLAGLFGDTSCLSTVMDAFNRGHNFTYLVDASASHALDEIGASEAHNFVAKLIARYGGISTTAAWIAAAPRFSTATQDAHLGTK